jgi:hypothetical protein
MHGIPIRMLVLPLAALALLVSASAVAAQELSDEVRREAVGRPIHYSGSRYDSSTYTLRPGGRYTAERRTIPHRPGDGRGGRSQVSGRYVIRDDGDVCFREGSGREAIDICYGVTRTEGRLEFGFSNADRRRNACDSNCLERFGTLPESREGRACYAACIGVRLVR